MDNYRIVNRSGVHRCSICNCVNVEDIQTDLGDYRGNMSFTNDPSNPLHFICIDCADEIEDLRQDYMEDDNELFE